MDQVRRVYNVIVRSPVSNAVVLGLVGFWACYSGVSSYLKQSEPWPGGLTLGVMAIICAAQSLAGSPRVEIMCSWRILQTFFGLYVIMKLMADVKGGIGFTIVKCTVVVGAVLFYAQIWRRPFADSWGLDSGEGVKEYSASKDLKRTPNGSA